MIFKFNGSLKYVKLQYHIKNSITIILFTIILDALINEIISVFNACKLDMECISSF